MRLGNHGTLDMTLSRGDGAEAAFAVTPRTLAAGVGSFRSGGWRH